MDKKIEKDKARFGQIIKGKIREDLKKYITKGELIGRQGNHTISIPLPQINIPHFKYDYRKIGGASQGDGEKGTPVMGGDDGDGSGIGAGDQPGQHIIEVEVSYEELAKMLGEQLALPNIQPKGKKNIDNFKYKYTGIRSVGPESLRHFKRTYRQALKRQISSNEYDYKDPIIIPIREDKKYRTWKEVTLPESNAVVILMMDVSGSMGDEQKELVRTISFWLDTWLKYQYKGIDTKYLVHDTEAYEVDKETFYHIREDGGTKISSVFRLANKIIDVQYSPFDWNIYCFYFSDGDNYGGDSEECIKILNEHLLNKSNLICYGQVDSHYGSGQFFRELESHYKESQKDKLIMSKIKDKNNIYDTIKTFLGKGV